MTLQEKQTLVFKSLTLQWQQIICPSSHWQIGGLAISIHTGHSSSLSISLNSSEGSRSDKSLGVAFCPPFAVSGVGDGKTANSLILRSISLIVAVRPSTFSYNHKKKMMLGINLYLRLVLFPSNTHLVTGIDFIHCFGHQFPSNCLKIRILYHNGLVSHQDDYNLLHFQLHTMFKISSLSFSTKSCLFLMEFSSSFSSVDVSCKMCSQVVSMFFKQDSNTFFLSLNNS